MEFENVFVVGIEACSDIHEKWFTALYFMLISPDGQSKNFNLRPSPVFLPSLTTMAAVGWQAAFGNDFDEEWPDDPQVDALSDRGQPAQPSRDLCVEPLMTLLQFRQVSRG
jgi:hypothetical protein